jgi:hypothetical protein
LQTTVIASRVPTAEAQAFREQAQRYGLTPSRALAALVGLTLAVDERADSDTGAKETTA